MSDPPSISSSYNGPYVDPACEVVKVVCNDEDPNTFISGYCQEALDKCAPYDEYVPSPTGQTNPVSTDYIPPTSTTSTTSTTTTTQDSADPPTSTVPTDQTNQTNQTSQTSQTLNDNIPTLESQPPMKTEEESIKILEDKGYTVLPPTESPTESPTEQFAVREGFSNKAAYGKKLLQLDLFLRALLYGCLFFLLAHPDTRSLLTKLVSKKNLMYVVPVIFALAYYVLNLYI